MGHPLLTPKSTTGRASFSTFAARLLKILDKVQLVQLEDSAKSCSWTMDYIWVIYGLTMGTGLVNSEFCIFPYGCVWKCCVSLNPMVLLIIIPFLNGYFIGNINPTFSDKPTWTFTNHIFFHFWLQRICSKNISLQIQKIVHNISWVKAPDRYRQILAQTCMV